MQTKMLQPQVFIVVQQAVPNPQIVHVAGSHVPPPLDELDDVDEPLELPELPAPIPHAPRTQVDIVGSMLAMQLLQPAPPMPQAVSSVPPWQTPLLSQQPVGHEVESQEGGGAASSSPLLPPLPPLLPLLPLPPLLPPAASCFPISPSPGPPVAQAYEKAEPKIRTNPKAAVRPLQCILSVYLPALPLQAKVARVGPGRRRRDLRLQQARTRAALGTARL
jgi:hypothetical protein